MDEAAIASLGANDGLQIYNGLDCCVTMEIFYELVKQLDDTTRQTYELSKSLQGPILEMNMRGLKVDENQRIKVINEFTSYKERLTVNFERLCLEGIGETIKWSSNKDVIYLLYTVFNLPEVKTRNAKGIYTLAVDRTALEKLQVHHFQAYGIIAHILALRDLQKKIGFLKTPIDADGRMRTNFNIAGTNTGRLSSAMSDFGTGTNLQNINALLRSIFVADKGMKFANIDLEQADSRNVGAICWNTFHQSHGEAFAGSYLDACMSGDLHTLVCSMAWTDLPWPGDPRGNRQIADGIAYRDLSYRDMAKKLGHGSNYYGKPKTMAGHTKIDQPLVKEFQDEYFKSFPCIPEWHKHTINQIQTTGQITTLFGRKRTFFTRLTDSGTHRAGIAYNPQSCTGDEMNLAMLRVFRSELVQLLVQVHDSLLMQYPEHDEASILPKCIANIEMKLPLVAGRELEVGAEAMTGWNWGYASDANPDGLKKWKGSDDRKRQRKALDYQKTFSLLKHLE